MRTSKRAVALGLALAGSLTLGGCGGATTSDIAAKVNGTVITEDAARSAAAQIREQFGADAGEFQTPSAVNFLVMAPFVLPAAEKAGITVSEQEARAALSKIADPLPETIDLVRTNFALASVQQQAPDAFQAVITSMRDAKITINPRYGSLDATTGQMLPSVPNWIEGTAGGDEPEGEHSPGDGHDHG